MGRSVAEHASSALDAARCPGACAHCSLPSGSEEFCCFGCEIAAELAREGAQEHAKMRAALILSVLLFMSVMMVSLFLYAEDVYALEKATELARIKAVFRVAAFVLSTPVVFLLGAPLLRRALRTTRDGRLSMDLLIVSGALASYGLSTAALFTGHSGVYFDAACAALVLTTLGRYLEARARAHASALVAPSLKAAAEPVTARVAGGTWSTLAPADIQPGMQLSIREEQVLPVDARVAKQAAQVSLAVVTGESQPVTVTPGAHVPAGAVPLSGTLFCTATGTARDSTLARLDELAKSLREKRAPVQRLADRFATWLVPIIWGLALTCLSYYAMTVSIQEGVVVALAVVLAACPCTYGIATPLAMWLSLKTALAHGTLIRDAQALESLAQVDRVVFDKTGTLTQSALRVVKVDVGAGCNRTQALAIAAGLEGDSRHPIARALLRYAKAQGIAPAVMSSRHVLVGAGVSGNDTEGNEWRLGAPEFAGATDPTGAQTYLVRSKQVVAHFFIEETLRTGAIETMARLHACSVTAAMATGDHHERAARIGKELGISVHAGLNPKDKARHLAGIKTTAMVGDGLNDAPALASVGASFAVDSASGLTRGVASVTLLRDDLRLVPWTLALAQKTRKRVHANLAWATAYNVVFVGLAAAGLLRPVWAALAMVTSSIVVVARTLRLSATPGPDGETA